MKVTFLGTGTSQGIPVITCDCEVCSSVDFRDNRTRTSAMVEVDGQRIVFDTGPDFRQQMLRERVKHVDAVVYTHEHKDHTAGLDDVRPFNFKTKEDMPIFGEERVLEQIKREFAYAFAEKKYPGAPQILVSPIENKPFFVKGVKFMPIRVYHHKLPVFGFRIHDFTYITDANYIAPEELDKVRGTKVLVLNALQQTPHLSHFTLQEALELIEEIAPEKAYLTHISHRMGLHAEVSEKLPEHVEIAYDGLKFTC